MSQLQVLTEIQSALDTSTLGDFGKDFVGAGTAHQPIEPTASAAGIYIDEVIDQAINTSNDSLNRSQETFFTFSGQMYKYSRKTEAIEWVPQKPKGFARLWTKTPDTPPAILAETIQPALEKIKQRGLTEKAITIQSVSPEAITKELASEQLRQAILNRNSEKDMSRKIDEAMQAIGMTLLAEVFEGESGTVDFARAAVDMAKIIRGQKLHRAQLPVASMLQLVGDTKLLSRVQDMTKEGQKAARDLQRFEKSNTNAVLYLLQGTLQLETEDEKNMLRDTWTLLLDEAAQGREVTFIAVASDSPLPSTKPSRLLPSQP